MLSFYPLVQSEVNLFLLPNFRFSNFFAGGELIRSFSILSLYLSPIALSSRVTLGWVLSGLFECRGLELSSNLDDS